MELTGCFGPGAICGNRPAGQAASTEFLNTSSLLCPDGVLELPCPRTRAQYRIPRALEPDCLGSNPISAT